MTVFKFYEDGAHGWLEVPRELLKELNLLDKISKFSYQKDDMVYLEEDCDATKFVRAYKGIYVNPKVVYHETSPVRGYSRFNNGEVKL